MRHEFHALDVRSARKHFLIRRHLLRRAVTLRAVENVSFAVHAGRVLGVVGESGSGKSTLANMLVGLETPTDGEILIAGQRMTRRLDAELRRNVQLVSQDPFGSLNPRFTVGRTVEEPMLIHGVRDPEERRRRAIQALDDAELRPSALFVDRLPHELSGGQRQRVAIARAIVMRPKLLIADEPVSMLDVSVRAGILRLLRRLVTETGMAMVFITHDLSIVGSICDELAVMYRGSIVEYGRVMDVIGKPLHPYTSALISAIPVPDPAASLTPLPKKLLAGAGIKPPEAGCQFEPRCSLAIKDCASRAPILADIRPAHAVACLRAADILEDRT